MDGQYSFRLVSSFEELAETLGIRNEVYALDRGWLSPSPYGMESDSWDLFSHHFVAYNDSREAVGTARMIMPSPLGFPFEHVADFPSGIDRSSSYEVSRLAVRQKARGKNSFILVGLCRAIWRYGNEAGKTHWCAVVDKPVAKLLKRLGFEFLFEGGELMHLGSVSIPIVCNMAQSREVLFSSTLDELLERHIEEIYG